MPHLTPMSWLMTLFIMWMLISTMNLMQWSIKPMKFIKPTKKSHHLTNKPWTWNLQDGR